MIRLFTGSAGLVALIGAFTASAGCTPAPPPQAPASAPTSTTPPAPDPARLAPAPAAPAASARRDGPRYSRADLEALEKQQSWSELVDHLEDIAPSERDAKWTALVALAVQKHLTRELETARDKRDVAASLEGYLRRYPSLEGSPAIAALRADIGVAAVESCVDEPSRWSECGSYRAMIEADPKKTIAAARVASRRGNRTLSMMFYRVASEKDAKGVCASDEAMAIVMEARTSPPDSAFYKDSAVVLDRCRKLKGN